MSTNNLPLQRLFTALQTAGLYLGPAERLRVQHLLADSRAEWRSTEGRAALMYDLAPLLCRNRTEQEAFYKAYETFLRELEEPVREEELPEKKGFWKRYWKTLTGLLTLMIAGWYVAQQIPIKENITISFSIKDGSKTSFEPGETIFFENQSIVKDTSRVDFIWTVREVTTQGNSPAFRDTAYHLLYLAPMPTNGQRAYFEAMLETKDRASGMVRSGIGLPFEVINYCNKLPRIQDSIRVEGMLSVGQTIRFFAPKDIPNGLKIEWTLEALSSIAKFTDKNPSHVWQRPGEYTLQLRLTDTTQAGYCTITRTKQILVQEDIPTLTALPLYKDTVKPRWTYTWLTKILALLAFALALWFAWRWWRRPGVVIPPPAPNIPDALRRAFESEPNDKSPYNIPYRSNNSQIRIAAEQIELANTFRRRQEGQVATLNISRTIGATMEKLGFTDLRFTYNTRPAHYLFLIDLQNEVSHQAQLFRYLVQMLEGQDVLADIFFYKNSLSRCWNRLHPEGLSLEQLALQYADRRLVVFGDGYRLIEEAEEGQALHKEQSDALRHWPRRMLVTPVPVAAWTYREARLYQLWAVFQADLNGLMQAARFVESGMDDENLPPTFAEWQRSCKRSRIDADTDREWDTPAEHRDYLRTAGDQDGAQYRWLRALSVYPELNWNVTIAIGKALGIDVRYEQLLTLARIPWLQTGAMKPALWRAWMREMPLPESAPDENLAREAVREELRAVEALCADGYADRKMQTRLAVQDFALAPADRIAQDNLYYVLQNITPAPLLNEELNRVVERKVPDFRWDSGSGTSRAMAYLQAGQPQPVVKRPFWTRDLLWCVLCWPFFLLPLLVGAERWAAAYEQYPNLVSWFVTPHEDEAVKLNNLAVEAYNSTTLSDKFRFKLFEDTPGNDLLVRGTKYYVAFHILNEAISIRQGNYDLAEANRARIFYNNGLSLISLKYPSGENVVGEKDRSERLQNGIAHLRIALRSDSVHIPVTEAFTVAFYQNNQPDSACYWMQQLVRLKPDYYNWLAAKRICGTLLSVTDRDGDSVPDSLDQCPDVPGQRSRAGCPDQADKDKDGIVDAYDQCPNQFGGSTTGCPVDDYAFDPEKFYSGAQTLSLFFAPNQPTDSKTLYSKTYISYYVQKEKIIERLTRNRGASEIETINLQMDNFFEKGVKGNWNYLRFLTEDLSEKLRNGEQFEITFSGFTAPNGSAQENYQLAENRVRSVINHFKDFDGGLLNRYMASGQMIFNQVLNGEQFAARGIDDGNLGSLVALRENRVEIKCNPATATSDPTATIADIQNNMVFVKGGTFRMGSNDPNIGGEGNSVDETPDHSVTLTDFYIGRTEVTIAQYLAFCDETKSRYPEWLEAGSEYHIETGTNDFYKQVGMSRNNQNHPVTGVSWNDAVAFCQWLSEKTGRNFRLPTEAEWEYAARGGQKWTDGYTYAGDNDPDKVAWFDDNSGSKTQPVARKKPNQLGIYDMSGNVWEWCSDRYGSEYYKNFSTSPAVNPLGPEKGGFRVYRGGGWLSLAQCCRSAYRDSGTPTLRGNDIGFRLSLQ